MAGNPYRRDKKGAGRHVQPPEWVQASATWATLSPGPRALYIEPKHRFAGANNGRIIFSHRDAAAALNVHRNTVWPWFTELQERGFIAMTQAPHLGRSGIGKASVWALGELPVDSRPASKAFMAWREIQMTRTKNSTPCHSACDSGPPRQAKTGARVLKIVTGLAVSTNRAT